MLTLLEQNLPYLDHRRRFDWAYMKNPSGRAWCWLAIEEREGQAVGIASLFPKMMWVAGTAVLCGQVADFAVQSKFRSLGPAMALQRATLRHVDDGTIGLCYDCPPHERGMAPLRRLGLNVTCQIGRFTRLLRANDWFARNLRVGPAIAQILALGPNVILRPRGHRKLEPDLEVMSFADRFGDEFTRLDEALVDTNVIRARRAAEDLNWRYRDDPLHRYETLVARSRRELQGYLVYEIQGDRALIFYLLAVSEGVALTLVQASVATMHAARVAAVTCLVPEGGKQSELARAAGFAFRGAGERIVAYSGPRNRSPNTLALPWVAWSGDVVG